VLDGVNVYTSEDPVLYDPLLLVLNCVQYQTNVYPPLPPDGLAANVTPCPCCMVAEPGVMFTTKFEEKLAVTSPLPFTVKVAEAAEELEIATDPLVDHDSKTC
jgi:hypothetical protein